MVLKKRLDYGFNGYQVPVVPRASRSARGKGPVRKKCEDKQTRAFDVLASVAGNFLRKGESSAPSDATCIIGQHDIVTSSVKWDQEDGEQFCQGHHHNYKFNEILHDHENVRFKGGLASKRFDHLEEIHVAEELEAVTGKNICGSPFSEKGSNHFGSRREGVGGINTESQLLNSMSIDSRMPPVEGSLKDAMETGCNPPVQFTSGSTLKMPFLRDFMAFGPFSRNCADVKVISRDNDENFVGCSQHCTMEKTHRSLLYTVDGRTRNLSDSRHWKVAPNLKVGGHVRAAGKKTPIHPSGRFCDDHERSQKIFPFKKRKFFDQIPDSMPDACHRNEEFNSSGKQLNGGHYHSGAQSGNVVFLLQYFWFYWYSSIAG
uniref:Telomere repeat-binding protein 5-like n=1 Tax=Rhizophora mucronata TaxID=61149 RepID=A0A2P2JKJ2_RHIMU